MKNFLVLVLLVAIAFAALGYWRGWLSVTDNGKVSVEFDPTAFKKDKIAITKSFDTRFKVAKEQVNGLWNKTDSLTGDSKIEAHKELDELRKRHDRLEQQIQDLENAGPDKFESIKHDLSKSLEEVEKRTNELTIKLQKGKEK